MKKRALVVAAIVAASWVGAGEAQQSAKVPVVGFLTPSPASTALAPKSIRKHLAVLGYIEGQNVVAVLRGDGDPQRLAELAVELVRMKVDVINAVTNEAAFAAKNATRTIPIVVWASHAAVETGLVKSLARPGGNVTGVESLAPELDARRLQMLKEIVPGLAKVGVLYNPTDQGSPFHLEFVRAAARALQVDVVPLEVRTADDLDRVLSASAGRSFEALVAFTDGRVIVRNWKQVSDFAQAHRIPTACEFRVLAQMGCLIAYGATFDEFSQRNARQIDLILKGAKAGDLPFEQVTRFELLVNMKTARAIGATIPRSVLLQATELIE